MQLRTIIPAVVALWWAAFAPAAGAGSLTGVVRNADDLTPIEGADVTVHVLIPDSIPFPTVTAADGSYGITGIIPDNEIYVVIAWKFGYQQSYTRVADLGSLDLVFDINLAPLPLVPPPPGGGDSGTVAGTIFETGDGGALSGLPGATVRLYAGGGPTETVSGAGGKYSAKIPAGSYAISVTGAEIDSLALTGLTVDSLGATVNAVVKKTVTGTGTDPGTAPAAFALRGSYPNPFNPSATIVYDLPEAAAVRLAVFDLLGREVAVLADGRQGPGTRAVSFDAGRLPGGVYFYRLVAGTFSAAGRMVYVR